MSLSTSHSFEFGDSIPLEPVEGGNSLLVTGPTDAGLDVLVHELVAPRDGEGLVAVTTDVSGRRFRDEQERIGGAIDDAHLRIVECDGSTTRDDAVVSVADPGELTDVNVHLSSLSDELRFDGTGAVRTGVYSVVPIVAEAADMRDVYRFLQNSISRTRRNGGLFVCAVDPDADVDGVDDGHHVVTGLSKAFQGGIELRGDRHDAELRVTGLDGQPEGWQSVDL
jgi:hypothetical protein